MTPDELTDYISRALTAWGNGMTQAGDLPYCLLGVKPDGGGVIGSIWFDARAVSTEDLVGLLRDAADQIEAGRTFSLGEYGRPDSN